MPRRRRLDWFRWYAHTFQASTLGWTFTERSIFRALLDIQWMCGVVPREPDRLAEALRCTREELEAAWPKVRTKFRRRRGGYVNDRLEEERQLSLQLYDSQIDRAQRARASR
jgi:uncharacterized protein YdaU (DUF1376 family)